MKNHNSYLWPAKKRIEIVLCLIVIIALTGGIILNCIKNAHAWNQEGDDRTSSKSWPGNNCLTYFQVEGPWGTSTIHCKIRQTNSTNYNDDNFNNASRTLSIEEVGVDGDNPYGLSFANSKPTTYKNPAGNYTLFDVKIKYNCPAHYYHSSQSLEAPSATSQNFAVSNTAGHSSSNHSVTTTIKMSIYNTGVTTYKVKNNVYRRYKNCKAIVRLWSRNKYKIYYYGNGGSVGQSEKEFYDGDNFTFPSATRDGYTLSGWRRDNDGGDWMGTNWVVCSTNFNAVAQWTANQYNVSFDGNGADSGDVDEITATYNSNFTLPQNGYKKKGYKFLGWSTNPNATSPQYTPSQTFTYKTLGTTTFYAIWEKDNFEVKFHGNGSSAADYTADLTYNKSVNLPKNIFERPGYTFIGWITDPTEDTVVPEFTDGQAVKDLCDPGDTFDLYALWRKTDGSFETQNIIHDENMFLGDVNITGQNGTEYSQNNIDSKSAKIDKEDGPGYFTDRYASTTD